MKGAHGVKMNMGIYSPKQSPPEINGHLYGRFLFDFMDIVSQGFIPM